MPTITKTHRSAWPIYITAGVWAVYALIRPLYLLSDLAICAALSAAAYLVSRRFFPPRVEEIEIPEDTGDAELNDKISAARAQLAQLRAFNDAIPGAAVSERLDRIDGAGGAILAVLEKNPAKAPQARRFLNYYLPTTVKLLEAHGSLSGPAGEHAQSIQESVESSLSMVAAAFENLLDQLRKTDAIDVTSEIQALETILASEGLSARE